MLPAIPRSRLRSMYSSPRRPSSTSATRVSGPSALMTRRLDIQVIKIYVPLERGLTEMSGFMGRHWRPSGSSNMEIEATQRLLPLPVPGHGPCSRVRAYHGSQEVSFYPYRPDFLALPPPITPPRPVA